MTISGTNFTGATTVRFGPTPATNFTVVSPTQITAVAPLHAAGSVNIRVTTTGGISAVVPADIYTYQVTT